MTFAIAFTGVNNPSHSSQKQPTCCGEHAVQQTPTEILSLVRYLGGLAEGQRVVLIGQLGSRAGELHSLEGERKDYPQEGTQMVSCPPSISQKLKLTSGASHKAHFWKLLNGGVGKKTET